MTTLNIVLVHGAWHGGWCWSRVSSHLQERKNVVSYAPTLSGLGERGHLRYASLATHVEDVVRVIAYNELKDVVLVGHSYAGMVITAVADRVRSSIRHLVYLDAAVPRHGDDFASHAPLDSAETVSKKRAWFKSLSKDGEWIAAPDPSLVGVTDPADAARLKKLMTPHPLCTWLDRVELSDAGIEEIEKTYILATNPAADMMGYPQRAEIAKRGGTWRYRSLDCGHDTMIIKPRETAELLLEAAG